VITVLAVSGLAGLLCGGHTAPKREDTGPSVALQEELPSPKAVSSSDAVKEQKGIEYKKEEGQKDASSMGAEDDYRWMNCIGGLVSNRCEIFDYTKNLLSQIISDEHSVIGDVVGKTVEVGKGVFLGVAPHLVRMSPMYLNRMPNMRAFSRLGLLYGVWNQLKEPRATCLDTAIAGVLIATNFIGLADLKGATPLETEYRVAVDSLLLLATVIGSSRSIYEGTKRMFSSLSAEGRSTSSKVSDCVSGVVMTTLGAIGIGSSLQTGVQLASGIKTLQTLDSVQKKGVLKSRAVHHLGGEKSCKAVIIDGFFSSLNLPVPFSEELYRNCETRTYGVNSSSQYCQSLADAKEYFGAPIDVLSLVGHSDNQSQDLGYFFWGRPRDTICMEEALSSEAQVFVLGCNTATTTGDFQTLTERLSDRLPGKEVIGFSSYYGPAYTSTSFSKGRFHHDSHFPYSLNGWRLPTSFVVEKKPLSKGQSPSLSEGENPSLNWAALTISQSIDRIAARYDIGWLLRAINYSSCQVDDMFSAMRKFSRLLRV
jgi:hypothetical protein